MTRLFAALAAFLAALPMAGADAAEALHRPCEAEPESLDPAKMTSGIAFAISRDLFEGLIVLDPLGRPVPGDAESWEITPDGKEWVFHLRHGLKWSNGEALTAADYVYAFRRLVNPATAAADPSDLKQLLNYDRIIAGTEKDLTKLGVDAPDPLTLRLHLTEPRLALKFLLTDPQTYPLNRTAIEQSGKDWTQPGHLVSNGAYTLKSWVPENDLVVTKNPLFYAAPSVPIDEVHWIGAEDMDAAIRRFRAGELDWVDCLRGTIQICRKDLAEDLRSAPINVLQLIVINMAKGVLAGDTRLREALNLATDRELLTTKIVPLGGQPAYGVVPPIVSDYAGPKMPFKDLAPAERITRAKALMQQAGYGPDHHLKVTISYPTRESTRQILLAIAHMWASIDVDVALDNMEFQIYDQHLNSRDYDLGIMGAFGAYDDFETVLDNYRSDAGDSNWTGYHNPKFDDLFHRGGTALDPAQRRDLMQQAEGVLLSDYPVIPLYFDMRNRVVSPKLQHFEAGVLYPQSRYLSLAE